MEEKEFTKEMYKLYVAQRKRLDEAVPREVKDQYIKKQQNYENYKLKQKERYHQRLAEGGEEFLKQMREKNNNNYKKRKEKLEKQEMEKREMEKQKFVDDNDSTIPESVSRFSRSITTSNYSVDDDDDDLESVFSEPRKQPSLMTHRFLGY